MKKKHKTCFLYFYKKHKKCFFTSMVIVYMYVCVICRTLCVIPRTLFLFCLLKYHLIAEIVQTVQRA